MGKQTIKFKKNKTIITNQLSSMERINERVYNAIVSGMIPGLIPLVVKNKKKECQLEVIVNDMVPLNAYFNRSGVVSKTLFLNVIGQIVNIAKACEKTMMSSNSLDLRLDRIFVEVRTGKVKCIYWPVVNNEFEMPIQLFFKQIVNNTSLNTYENTSYINEYMAFFNTTLPFSLNSFERMIVRMAGKVATQKNMPTGAMVSNEEKPDQPIQLKKEEMDVNVEYDPFAYTKKEAIQAKQMVEHVKDEVVTAKNYIFCSQCGDKNDVESKFCKRCGNKLSCDVVNEEVISKTPIQKEFIPHEGTTVLGCDTGGTTVLGYDEPELPSYPYLIRKKNDEKIMVNKPVFRIGKERKYCDYFVLDNNAVSRSHADIITKNKRYYIVDLHSTNKTYVDNRVIPVEVEVEIFSGTSLRLANEDFTFYIES